MSEVRKIRGSARFGVLLAADRELLPPPPRNVVHEGVDAVRRPFEADRPGHPILTSVVTPRICAHSRRPRACSAR